VIAYGLLPSGAQLTLDRASKHGNAEQVLFLSLDYGDDGAVIVARRVFTDRVDDQPDWTAIGGPKIVLMSELNQCARKEQAVHEINRFLKGEDNR